MTFATKRDGMFEATVWALLRDARVALGWKFVFLLVLIPMAGILEGFSLTLLLPLMVTLGVTSDASTFLSQVINALFSALGLSNGIGSVLLFLVMVLQVQVLLTLCRNYLEVDVQTRYQMIWQRRLFEAFVSARWLYSLQERTAAQTNAIITETGRITTSLGLLIQIIGNLALAAIYAVISLSAAWQVVLLLGGLGVVIFVATRPLTRRGSMLGYRLSEAAEATHHVASEFLTNLKLLKATATERRAIESFKYCSEDYRSAGLRAGFHPRIVLSLYMSLGYFMLGGGVYVAIDILSLSPASIVISIYVFLRLYMQISNFQQSRQTLAITLPGLAVASDLLARARAAAESLNDGLVPHAAGPASLLLDKIEVRYGGHVALRDLSVAMSSGAVVGITGSSGAGKSTFIDVVAGLIEPVAGMVLDDDIPLERFNLTEWRRSIGYVAQDTLLLRGTVWENIAWSLSGATDADVRAAARLAHADGFIQALPQGYDTLIGDRGVRLSGGQRQRIGMARALLGRKRLLIMDEATSALDSESEAKILEAVESLRGRVSVIMVAHRLSTLRLCDKILVLEEGHLVEEGSFSALVERGGQFAHLWSIQSKQVPVDINPMHDQATGESPGVFGSWKSDK